MADPQKAALAAAWAVQQISAQDWNYYCERFAENAFGTSGRYPSALAAGNALPLSKALDKAKPGDMVLFSADETNDGYGHAGIYIGNGEMVSATPNGVKREKILSNPYWAQRFRGVADAPDDWQGRTSTPELEQGAQQLIAQATGAATMADPKNKPLVDELTRQRDGIKAQLDEAKRKQADYQRASQNPELTAPTISRPRLGGHLGTEQVPNPKYDPALVKALDNNPSALEQEIAKHETALRDVGARLATAAGTPDTPSSSAADPKGTTRTKLHAFPDGNQYVVTEVADGLGNWATDTTKPPAPYGPQRAAPVQQRRTQVVDNNLIDLDTGAVITRLPESAKNRRTQAIGTKLIDLDTGATIADLTDALAKPEKPEQPHDLSTPTGQPFLVRRLPDGTLEQTPNPNYQPPEEKGPTFADPVAAYNNELTRAKQQANQLAATLKRQAAAGEITWDEAHQKLQDSFSKLQTPLEGYRSAAEERRATQQREYDKANADENYRAATYEQTRQTGAETAGRDAVAREERLLPFRVGPNFREEKGRAEAAYASGKDYSFSPDSFVIDAPNLEQIAHDAAAHHLASVSPYAASMIGAPPPRLPDPNTLNLDELMGRLAPPQLPAPSPVPPPDAPSLALPEPDMALA